LNSQKKSKEIYQKKDLIFQETTFDEEESLTLHYASFDKELKKPLFESVNSRGKRVKNSTMDLRRVSISKL
jgi:hypothetical protein